MEVVARYRDRSLGCDRRRPMIVVGLEEHHRPRAIEGALPDRVLCVRNVETPSGSGLRSGKPTARKAQLPGGHRMTKKANASSRKAAGNRDRIVVPFTWLSRITGWIPSPMLGRESVADVVR
jgi:hypothetical protein